MAISTTDMQPLAELANRMTVAGILLAAGEGSRFVDPTGSHKLLAEFRGRPLAAWALEAALDAGFHHLYVVQGAVDLSGLVDEVAEESGRSERVSVVTNTRWSEGQATSLKAGIDAATADGHASAVVGLADQPLVPTAAWRSVGASAGTIVTATFDGDRRPPVKLDRSVWAELPTTGDDGARILFQLRPELVSELPCSGNGFDIDTTEDLEKWN